MRAFTRHMLDSTAHDLQVEGAIAKYFATEVADRAANDAIQALGGYGYICEFGVEKIKRDVKITCIYEGTSEIQQNIISTFRWKTTRKTKGEFYGALAADMDRIATEMMDAGVVYYALAARALNHTIDFVHNNRLTHQQAIMFALSDMMTYVEVGIALARKAWSLTKGNDAEAEKLRIMARVFAGEVCQVVGENAFKIFIGRDTHPDQNAMDQFLTEIAYSQMLGSRLGWVVDMDKIADMLFER